MLFKSGIIIFDRRRGLMKDLTWIKKRMIAHRGLHSLDKTVPENSMKAFELAIDKNYGI